MRFYLDKTNNKNHGNRWKKYVIMVLCTILFVQLTPHYVELVCEYESNRKLIWYIHYAKENEPFNGTDLVRVETQSGAGEFVVRIPVKRLERWRIDPGDDPGMVIIDSLTLRGNKTTLRIDNLSNFEFVNISKYQRTGNRNYLYFDNIDPYIISPGNFSLKAFKRNIDPYSLVVIMLAIIFTYKQEVCGWLQKQASKFKRH